MLMQIQDILKELSGLLCGGPCVASHKVSIIVTLRLPAGPTEEEQPPKKPQTLSCRVIYKSRQRCDIGKVRTLKFFHSEVKSSEHICLR